jgi:isopenicillin-N N-acyltransferase-like protein
MDIKGQIVHNSPPIFVQVKGSHRQIGQQIGEALKEQVRHSLENAHVLLDSTFTDLELTWEGAKIQAKKYNPFAQERYPQYMDEMLGISEGANVSFDDIAVLNAMEAVTTDALHLTKCTSLAVNGQRTMDGSVLVGHNEDWLPEDEPDVCVLQVTSNDEPPFIAMSYGGLLPNIGFNAAGLAQCCDSVYPKDSRIGIPRVIASRAVLGARTPAEAMRHMLVSHRAAGYNHLLVHESGELYSVEVSARRFAILYGHDGYLVHTNHYLDPRMSEVEDEPDELIDTRVRYFRALRLIKQSEQHSIKTLQAIQRDHVNFPNSICNHAEEDINPIDREKTINASIMDLTERVMYLSWGNPCSNQYYPFYLED